MGNYSATELAEHIGVARATISRILNGRTAVTMDLSIRLGEAFSLSPDFFSKAQLQRDFGKPRSGNAGRLSHWLRRNFPLKPKEGLDGASGRWNTLGTLTNYPLTQGSRF